MKKTILICCILLMIILGCKNSPTPEIKTTTTSTCILTTSTTITPSSTTNSSTTILTSTTRTSTTTTLFEIENKCKIIMFHNGQGPMCVEQLDFLEDVKKDFPLLVVEEYLTTEQSNRPLLYEMEAMYSESYGVSDTFGYLPISFINNHAYSGFNGLVEEYLLGDIEEVCR